MFESMNYKLRHDRSDSVTVVYVADKSSVS